MSDRPGVGANLEATLAVRLRAAMDGMPATELAELAGLHQNSIYRVLRGQGLPRVPQLVALADVLGVSVDWMLARSVARSSRERRASRALLRG